LLVSPNVPPWRAHGRRSPVPLLVCCLALVTALALLGAGAALSPPPLAADPTGANREVVRRFYDAVNAALRTDDTSALAAVVAADFVAHPPPLAAPGPAGLARYLAALRAGYPALRLTVEEVVVEDDRAVARVRPDGAALGTFLGLPLAELPPPWGTIDWFRLADGRIAERWSAGDTPVLLEEQRHVHLGGRFPSRPVVALAQTTYAPGGWEETVAGAARILVVESGALAVAIEPRSPVPALISPAPGDEPWPRASPVAPGSALSLTAGGLIALPEGSRYTIHNAGSVPAVALDLTLISWVVQGDLAEWVVPAFAGGGPTSSGGIAAQPLAGGVTAELPAAARLAFGRATIPAARGRARRGRPDDPRRGRLGHGRPKPGEPGGRGGVAGRRGRRAPPARHSRDTACSRQRARRRPARGDHG
jgi:predicted ester cyclase